MHFLTQLLLATTPEPVTVAEINVQLQAQDIEVVGVWGTPERDAIREQGVQGTVVIVSGADSLRAVLQEQGQDCGLLLAHPSPETWTPRTVCVKKKLTAPVASVPVALELSGEDLALGLIADLESGKLTAGASTAGASTAAPPATDRLAELLAMPDHATRKKAILVALQLPDTPAADLEGLSAALAVVGALEEQDRTDPFVVRLFLQGALALDAESRQRAVTAAREGGDPPNPSVGTVAAPLVEPSSPPANLTAGAPSPDLAVLRRYKQERLVRGPLITTTTVPVYTATTTYSPPMAITSSESTWTVYDGAGGPMSYPELLRKAGHPDQAQQATRDTQQLGRRAGVMMLAGATGGAVFGFSYLDSAGEWNDPEVQLLLGLTIVSTATLFVGAYKLGKRLDDHQPKNHLTTAEADALIEEANARLRDQLSLTEEETRSVDLK